MDKELEVPATSRPYTFTYGDYVRKLIISSQVHILIWSFIILQIPMTVAAWQSTQWWKCMMKPPTLTWWVFRETQGSKSRGSQWGFCLAQRPIPAHWSGLVNIRPSMPAPLAQRTTWTLCLKCLKNLLLLRKSIMLNNRRHELMPSVIIPLYCLMCRQSCKK